jgi:hypothetical protein
MIESKNALDVPLRLDNPVELARVQDLLLAQNDWRSKLLAVDVVLLNTAIGPLAMHCTARWSYW